MKIDKSLILFGIYLFLLPSCSQESLYDTEEQNRPIPLNISGSINGDNTKASSNGFSDGDGLGLYAVNYSNNNSQQGKLLDEGNQADNVKYRFDAKSNCWIPAKKVYYKDIHTNVDIYLYYPYIREIPAVSSSDFEVKSNQDIKKTSTSPSSYEASDFLWGMAIGVAPTESTVNVMMEHRLSSVSVTLTEGDGFSKNEFSSASKSVIVTNTTRKATIDYSTGVATAVGTPQKDGIVMCRISDDLFKAIIIPQGIASGTSFLSVTIDGIWSELKFNEDVVFKPGKQRTINIKVDKKSPSGEYSLTIQSSEISDWTVEDTTFGDEARQYYVVNVTSPGLLGKTIKAAGKNPDRIRNLKVVGAVSHNDIYFMRDSMAILESVNMQESSIAPTHSTKASVRLDFKEEDGYDKYIRRYGEPDKIAYGEAIWYDNTGGIFPGGAFSNKKTLINFIFPETLCEIRPSAFQNTKLSGPLNIPDDVIIIGSNAFGGTSVTSLKLPETLEEIGMDAFSNCSLLSGSLYLPPSLLSVGPRAFQGCNFSGYLHLPESLQIIDNSAFKNCGAFSGGLAIPASVKSIDFDGFSGTKFYGELVFEGNPDLAVSCFAGCGFSGTLKIPDNIVNIPQLCFYYCNFTNIILPSSALSIGNLAFYGNNRLLSVHLPESLISIGQQAFSNCSNLLSISFPASVQTIQKQAFENCFMLSSITSSAIEPPTVQSGAFNGVSKENFALEVPDQSLIRYQSEVGWSDFRRIVAHHDFSIERTRLRLLNSGTTKEYILRCPSSEEWTVENKPDWITVSPSSGKGKTTVSIKVSDMARTNNTFNVNLGSYDSPKNKQYKGRTGCVTFKLSSCNYECKLTVEQFDYDHKDGEVITHQRATVGKGIDIVFIGEGYDARDIVEDTFLSDTGDGVEHFFAVEPYSTYKNYFNVYSVISMSGDSGIENVNTTTDNKFIDDGVVNTDDCFNWARKASANSGTPKAFVILLENTPNRRENIFLWNDGTTLSEISASQDPYPQDFRSLVQHVVGGHAFGKLCDEYYYHMNYLSTCPCLCCKDHPNDDYDLSSFFGQCKLKGWFQNVSMSPNYNSVPWAHLVFHPKYSDKVDMFEGAYYHSRGIYRSEIESCMSSYIPYYSAISRQAIVERIMLYSGEHFNLEDFYAKDSDRQAQM